MSNFWKELKRPIMGMAPMDGVTDAAFRHMLTKYGKPDVMFTEFVPVDAIYSCLHGVGNKDKILNGLIYGEEERPIVAQIFGSNPEKFYTIAPFICELGFDGIDVNMGCPEKSIVKSGCGSALIDDPKKAKEIITALQSGIKDWANGKNLEDFGLPKTAIKNKIKKREIIPVSVKTRIGTKVNTISEWAKYLSEMNLSNVSIHGRTVKQMYLGIADWEAIAEGAEIIKKSGISVLGNGDIKNIEEGKEKSEKYKLDGVLVGRNMLGNPLFFVNKIPTLEEKLKFALEHAKFFEKIFEHKQFAMVRKHLSWYVSEFHDAREIRSKLMSANSAKECGEILNRLSDLNYK